MINQKRDVESFETVKSEGTDWKSERRNAPREDSGIRRALVSVQNGGQKPGGGQNN